MRRLVGVIIVIACLALLIHDVQSGYFSTFRKRCRREDLDRQLMQLWRWYVYGTEGDLGTSLVLVARGADPNTALGAWSDETLLHQTALQADTEAARFLLGRGVDIERTYKRYPALRAIHVAAEKGNHRMVDFLVEHGADPNGGAPELVQPLSIAAAKGHAKVAAVLVKKGADMCMCNDEGVAPFHLAAIMGHDRVVSCLLDNGMDIHAKDRLGGTALHLAARNGKADVVEVLLSRGADVNAGDPDQDTPLHAAASALCFQMGHLGVEIAEILIRHGADVNLRDRFGRTPLHIAADRENKALIALLLQHGTDVNAKNKDQRRPLDCTGQADIRALLIRHGARTGREPGKQTAK